MTLEAPRVLLVGPVDARDGGATIGGIASHVSDLARALSRAGAPTAVYADNIPPAPGGVPDGRAPVADSAPWGRLYARAGLGRDGASLSRLSGLGPATAARTLAAVPTLRALGQGLPVTLAHVLGLREAMSDFRPQVVHYHQADFRPLYGRLAGVGGAARRAGTAAASLVTVHSLSHFEAGRPEALQRLVIDNLRRTRLALAVSEDVALGLRELAPGLEVRVVPNGIELDVFSADGPRADLAAPTVLFAGRVCEEKGVPELIEAMGRLRARRPDVRLALAGPVRGVDPEALAAAAGLPKESLSVLGPVDAPRLAELLRGAAILVFPSLVREGQGRAVIEAMAVGTPVVASAVGAVPGLLEHGGAGLLAPPGDADALADAMASVLDDPEAASGRVRRGLDLARTFGADEVAARVLGTYRDLLDRPGAS